ncbi:ribulose-phosphate 3-epimerase [Mycoplasma sp. SG1]|uniref:ribulose-phosphate 3-epimerase n=1 Tax=Mycoplasma sp. SG1 TaxID=2810348 RepID=UPI002024180F|nr:ribulose-phosphate 3-epimerase [Mycoplasma sp. SG1]URM53047.1 ribulose-phosphate 3-epimerase [Mycoplasma sp. SG1]
MEKVKPLVSCSVLGSNFLDLKNHLINYEKNKVDLIHYDVMDGRFVPNISFGPKIMKDMFRATSLKFDVHLMVTNPEMVFHLFLSPQVRTIIFHFEALNYSEIKNLIRTIKASQQNIRVGIAIKPKTNPEQIFEYLSLLDQVLVMSVEPGFGGQKFIQSTYIKLKKLRNQRLLKKLNFEISVDGGVNNLTAPEAVNSGVDILVVGTYLTNNLNDADLIVDKFHNLRSVY